MDTYLVIDGNAVYEIDQECAKNKHVNHISQPVRSHELEQPKGVQKGRCKKRTSDSR